MENFTDNAFKTFAVEIYKDDLQQLLTVKSILNQIEERQIETDRMFDPLKDIAAMLKEYNYEFEKKIYDQVKNFIEDFKNVICNLINFFFILSLQNFQKNGIN